MYHFKKGNKLDTMVELQ